MSKVSDIGRHSLDPADWDAFRGEAHRLLDTCLDHLREAAGGEGPVWTPVPQTSLDALGTPVPRESQALDETLARVRELILANPTGNVHPRFFGWVHGAGSATGVLAEMTAAAMNANCGGRDHAAIHVERQVVGWCREIFGFPRREGGTITSGTSMATVLAVHAARVARQGRQARGEGAKAAPQFTGYCSARAHSCVRKAFELSGIGGDFLRTVAVDTTHAIDLDALRAAIASDRAAGLTPLFVVGCAGTVDIGGFDALAEIADIAADQKLWFHVDGAFGAWTRIAGEPLAAKTNGIERADSLACDFHKWISVPYDAAILLVRDEATLGNAFSARPDYLAAGGRALGGGDPWPCEFGIDLSRGFRALKVWMQFQHHGTRQLGAVIANNCAVASHLAHRVEAHDGFELAAPVGLNICCLFMRMADVSGAAADAAHRAIVADLQASGIAAPSTTVIGGRTCVRVAIVNHRTTTRDADILFDALVARLPAR